MNLLDKRLGLLLITALLLFSCEEEVGELNITPENNLGIFFGELTLEDKVSQIWAGSAASSFNGRFLAGSYNDSIFGQISSTAFIDYTIASLPVEEDFTTAELKSIDLKIRVQDIYGDFESGEIQKFDVYEIDDLDSEQSYSSSLETDLGEKIGSIEFPIFPDSLNLTVTEGVDPAKFDSQGLYEYFMSVDLAEEFQTNLFDLFKEAVIKGTPTSDDDIDSSFFFVDQILPGLAIVPAETNTAIIENNYTVFGNFDFRLMYSLVDTDGIKENEAILIPSASYNKVSPNEEDLWPNGNFESVKEINVPFNSDDDYIYFQSGTNMFFSIDASEIETIQSTNENIIIQKATISLENINMTSSLNNSGLILSVVVSTDDLLREGIYNNTIDNGVFSDLPRNENLPANSTNISLEIPLYFQELSEKSIPFNQIIFSINPVLRDSNFTSFYLKKEDVKLTYYYTSTN